MRHQQGQLAKGYRDRDYTDCIGEVVLLTRIAITLHGEYWHVMNGLEENNCWIPYVRSKK